MLSPIQAAAEKSGIVRELLESRRIFQPAAWTSRDAYTFLRDVPLFEEANIVVRIANFWKTAPPKATVSVSLDVAKRSRLGADALLNFSVNLTLGGEPLSPEEMEALLHSEGGLVRIRGQWVERIDRNYFVEMTPEQKKRYGEYETTVSRLCAAARKRFSFRNFPWSHPVWICCRRSSLRKSRRCFSGWTTRNAPMF